MQYFPSDKMKSYQTTAARLSELSIIKKNVYKDHILTKSTHPSTFLP